VKRAEQLSRTTDSTRSAEAGRDHSPESDAPPGADAPTAQARALLRRRGRQVGERELDRAAAELDLDPTQREALEAFVARLVAGVLANPDAALRASEDETVAAAALALFEAG